LRGAVRHALDAEVRQIRENLGGLARMLAFNRLSIFSRLVLLMLALALPLNIVIAEVIWGAL
jgi:hypothetical protein